MINLLLIHLRATAYDKKPNVDDLKQIEGLEEVTSKTRDEAWATYQAELLATKTESDKKESTPTTDTTKEAVTAKTDIAKPSKSKVVSDEPTHTVTVKKDGFRRCGRAWSGRQDVKLSDQELKILEADPMFVVVEL